jgi:hypothetical protein
MRKGILAAVIAAAVSTQPALAADRSCYSPADIEAEQAFLFQTNVMVISSACHDTVYGQFRARVRDEIIRYQNAMIDHFRRSGSKNPRGEFDAWQTGLANELSLKQSATSTAQVCQQATDILKMASTLDSKGFREYAVAHAASATDSHPKCGR